MTQPCTMHSQKNRKTETTPSTITTYKLDKKMRTETSTRLNQSSRLLTKYSKIYTNTCNYWGGSKFGGILDENIFTQHTKNTALKEKEMKAIRGTRRKHSVCVCVCAKHAHAIYNTQTIILSQINYGLNAYAAQRKATHLQTTQTKQYV